MATTTEQRTAHLLELMTKGDDLFNARDWQALEAVHHPDMIAHVTGSAEPIYGREAHAAAMQQLVRMFPDIRVHTPYPIQFGSGDWITVVTNVTGTFTVEMTLPDGTVIPPDRKGVRPRVRLDQQVVRRPAHRNFRLLGRRAPGPAARHRAVARVSSGWRILLLIGLLNLVVLAGIVRVFASMRRGEYDEGERERQVANRGFCYRFFGRWMTAITKEWQLYPGGVVFGLGFDTASEVALLATTGLLASQHIPWYAIICLPILFTAGMTFMDTTDGLLMNLAYGWAFFNPIRKVYYNLTITGLSVAICFGIGAVEVLSLLPQQIHGLSRTTGFWGLISRFNINTAGFVIVGLFLAAWLAALLIWRYARIEEKWNPAPSPAVGGEFSGGSP